MARVTGFTAYAMYVCTKHIHLTTSKYDLSTFTTVPKKEMLVKKWNTCRRDKDGKFFYMINHKFPTMQDLLELYCFYWLDRQEFYVKDIIDDEYSVHKKYMTWLKDPINVVKADWFDIVEYCEEHDIALMEAIMGPKLPQILQMSITPITLVVLNEVFGFFDTIEESEVNVLMKDKYKRASILIKKITPIFNKYFVGIDWKSEFKNMLRSQQ